MKKIKSLICLQWLHSLIGSLIALLLLLTVGNLVAALLRGNVTIMEALSNHLLTLPSFSDRILPVCCLGGSLFSIDQLKKSNQLTAIFAGGFTRQSFFFTIFQMGLSVALFNFLLLGFIDPYMKKNQTFFGKNLSDKFGGLEGQGLFTSTLGSGKVWYRTDEYLFSFSAYNKKLKELTNAKIFFFKEDKVQKIISAKTVSYKSGRTWTFKEGKILSSLSGKTFPKEEPFERIDLSIKETLSDFNQIESDITTLDIFSLRNYVRQLNEAGINTSEYQSLLLSKVAPPVTCILFALLASLGALNPSRRGSSRSKNLRFIFVSVMVFWLVNSYLLEKGKNGQLSPFLANFLMPGVFLALFAFILSRHRKLT